MGIASFSTTSLFGSFQGLVGWLNFPAKTRALHPPISPRQGLARGNACGAYTGTAPTRSACPAHVQAAPLRPLRVLRVLDAQHTSANAGRMVISGRMADVCAELDRLAALEATPRGTPMLQ